MKFSKIFLKTFVFILSLIAFSSCSNDSEPIIPIHNPDPTPTPTPATVYVAGVENNGTRKEARMWKENISLNLHTGNFSESVAYSDAGSILVKGNNIYVFGSAYHDFFSNSDLNYKAVMWKNGITTSIRSYLSSSADIYDYFPMFATGTDIYYVINEVSPYQNSSIPHLYKNTENNGTPLTDPNIIPHSSASSMFITSNNKYVVLNQYTSSNAKIKLWKDGQITSITDGSSYEVGNSIYVSNNDVYIAGWKNGNRTIAKVWKNGVPTSLTNGNQDAYAKSVIVKDNDVYVAGYEKVSFYISKAKYWKNGVEVPLTDGTHNAWANSISVYGSDVYVVGVEVNDNNKKVAKIWKNGVATSLTDGTNDAEAKSIFIE